MKKSRNEQHGVVVVQQRPSRDEQFNSVQTLRVYKKVSCLSMIAYAKAVQAMGLSPRCRAAGFACSRFPSSSELDKAFGTDVVCEFRRAACGTRDDICGTRNENEPASIARGA